MRFRLRTILVVVGLVAVLLAIATPFYRQLFGPAWASRAIRGDLHSLVTRRPPTMTTKEWESAVAWTINLHGNSLLQNQASLSDITDFQVELEDRLRGPVDMSTIEWIWDRFAALCPAGARYQKFRPIMLDEIARGGSNWGLNVP